MSFNLDFSAVFTNASALVNSLFGVYTVPLGITLAIGILGLVVRAFQSIVRGI